MTKRSELNFYKTVYIRYRHRFAYGYGPWEWAELQPYHYHDTIEKGIRSYVETVLAKKYEYSGIYRGAEWKRVRKPPNEILKEWIRESRDTIRAASQALKRYEQALTPKARGK